MPARATLGAIARPKLAVIHARSEGLAVASIHMFAAGGFSSDPGQPLRVDNIALENLDAATLARHFQADAGNPLIGLEQRSVLLRALGSALSDRSDLFGAAPARPGNLVDHLRSAAGNGRIGLRSCCRACSTAFPRSGPPG